jgi:hypothetical protein
MLDFKNWEKLEKNWKKMEKIGKKSTNNVGSNIQEYVVVYLAYSGNFGTFWFLRNRIISKILSGKSKKGYFLNKKF